MTRKSRKLRSSFCEVDYCGERFKLAVLHPATSGFGFPPSSWWPLIKGFISRELSVIGMKVSFRNFDSQFISYCVLIQKS